MNSKKLIVVGMPMIAVTYGLSRFSFGLMLPFINESINMNPSTSGLISSLSYLAYCIAILLAILFSKRVTPKFILLSAGFFSVVGLGLIAVSSNPFILGLGIFVACLSTGFSSPPYAAIVSTHTEKKLQNKTNSWINSGTSIGIAFTGLIAILLMDHWRVSYFIYMGIAIFVLLLHYKLLPEDHSVEKKGKISLHNKHWKHSFQLIIASILLGIASSAYWTFSRDYILNLDSVPGYLGEWFWVIIGTAGLLGGTVGTVINKFGIVSAYRISVVLLSTSLLTLVLLSGNKVSGLLSPVLFGSSYIFMSGVLIIWGISVFKRNPSLGLGVPFILLAFGQMIGSIFAGILAGMEGYHFLFIVFSLVGYVSLLFKPKSR